uniref:F-ATPase gamma subunit n=1 Tax=Wollemia nobilis TaxID=56998 RepID=A0A0C9SB59_9CONI
MACANLTLSVCPRPSITLPVYDGLSLSSATSLPLRRSAEATDSSKQQQQQQRRGGMPQVVCDLRTLRARIDSVKNTKKITDAMKLVAAAKVRRAQEAVVNGRPFSETLVQVLYNLNEQLQTEDVDIPLTQVRPVRKIALVVVTGDRGLCGGFNNFVIKKAEQRMKELRQVGVEYTIVSVGKKGSGYFQRRPQIPVDKFLDVGSVPTTKEAQAIADDIFSLFISEEVDKVELLYTKFVSLIKADPVIHTLLPLSPKGEVCDVNGVCVDAAEDEMFRLTTRGGKLTVERETLRTPMPEFSSVLQFEQDPVQILDALLPLYLNSQILRALQESVASELAARMNAMTSASDNAEELTKTLKISYNRQRQAKVTGEILEIVAGANSLT